MASPRQKAVLGLLPAATIVGHAASYALAGRSPHLRGGALELACWPVAALALAVLVWLGVNPRGTLAVPAVRQLAAAQLTLFLLQELAEGKLFSGAEHATWSTIRYGVAGQIIVATLTVVLARVVASAGARLRRALVARALCPSRRMSERVLGPVALRPRFEVAGWTSERGPPSVVPV